MTEADMAVLPDQGSDAVKTEPWAVGTFALYPTPDGGLHLTLRHKTGEEQHIPIPAWAVKLYMEHGENMTPGAMLKGMLRRKK
jgi:hypothetical protein